MRSRGREEEGNFVAQKYELRIFVGRRAISDIVGYIDTLAPIYKMTRQEFLKSIWTKFFKPILIIGILAFFVRFFIYALDAESEERQFINLIGFGFVVGGLLISIGFLLQYVSYLVLAHTPDGVKGFFHKNSKRIRIGFKIVLITIGFYFAGKFIVKEEYGNLIGLIVVVGLTFLQQILRTRE